MQILCYETWEFFDKEGIRKGKAVEILCKSDYQNVYRIMDGVLLVVDKFEYISFENDQYPSVYRRDNKRIWKKYTQGCESGLVELVVKYKKEYMG